MSNAITEIDNTDLVFIFGYNPADSHPIVANHVINAKRNGAKIIVCDPRKIETARIADMHIALKNGSNIALLNAIGHVIIEEDLYDKSFVASRSEGFEEYRKIVEGYTPESVEEITGVSAREIRACARMYASAKSAAILWGMGVTQFYQGVETVRSLTSLAILTGNLGKPNVGVNPVRGQNNVQGACDMGALPDTYPGYQYVKFPENREKFAKAWGVESLPAHTGYRISELPHRAAHGEVRAAYIMGEDPLQTDAELSAVRKAFDDLELVIVEDIFMTKTASAADVILPSTSWGEHEGVYTAADRGFQRFFKAVEPKWDLKTDWQIISEIATRMGYPMHYNNTRRSGTSCGICARTSTAPPTRKWVSSAMSCGRAAMSPTPIRERRICLKRSSIPRTDWRSSSPATGSRRSISLPTSTRWYCRRCARSAITRAVQ